MQSVDLPLASHCQFASDDFGAMHNRLSATLKPHRLRRLSSVPVSGLICRATLKRTAINLMRIGPAVDVWPGSLEKFFLVQVPMRGAVEISLGDDRVRCEGMTAAVISPGERLRLRWSDNCTQLILQIPREAMEARLAERSGFRPQVPLRFQTAFDLGRSAGREWRELLDFVVGTLERGGACSREPLSAGLEELLLSTLLAVQPHTYTDALEARHTTVPSFILRAEQAMREHLALPLTVAQVADAAGVSARTLHDGFRRYRGTTPMARLTALRLAAARRRMLEARSRTTVASVAAEVGMFQFGRFARSYRKAYGELPSETLRAARRGKG